MSRSPHEEFEVVVACADKAWRGLFSATFGLVLMLFSCAGAFVWSKPVDAVVVGILGLLAIGHALWIVFGRQRLAICGEHLIVSVEVGILGQMWSRRFLRSMVRDPRVEIVRFGKGTSPTRYLSFDYEGRRVRVGGEIGQVDGERIIDAIGG